MYARHVPALNAAIAASPYAWERAALLALVSIRRPFWHVPAMLADVRARGEHSRELFGWKRKSYQFITSQTRRMWNAAKYCEGNLHDTTLLYMQVPGFNIVKAQFLAQMTFGDGACLDSVNCNLYGISAASLGVSKRSGPRIISRGIRRYNELWRAIGTSQYFWDTWCETIAARVPERLPSAYAVSKLHADCVIN